MLQELRAIQQVPGERHRRWFFGQEQDVVVWLEADGRPAGFQLAYDKLRAEHSFSWHVDKGYSHYRVDAGRTLASEGRTPLLHATATGFPAQRVATEFRQLAADLPADITDFILGKMLAYASA